MKHKEGDEMTDGWLQYQLRRDKHGRPAILKGIKQQKAELGDIVYWRGRVKCVVMGYSYAGNPSCPILKSPDNARWVWVQDIEIQEHNFLRAVRKARIMRSQMPKLPDVLREMVRWEKRAASKQSRRPKALVRPDELIEPKQDDMELEL